MYSSTATSEPPQANMGVTTLYRAFDARGQLLYVGISDSPFLRLGQHDVSAAWTRYTTTVTLERHATREDAATAEREAIHNEDPVWNIQGRPVDRFMRWMAAYPDGDPDEVDLDALLNDARRLVDGLIPESGGGAA